MCLFLCHHLGNSPFQRRLGLARIGDVPYRALHRAEARVRAVADGRHDRVRDRLDAVGAQRFPRGDAHKRRVDRPNAQQYIQKSRRLADDAVCRKIRRVNEGCVQMNENIRAQARAWLAQGKLVGLVGGDHSTPYGLVQALGERGEGFGILHIDAHCDLRDAYEGFEFSHASIMFNVLRDVPAVTKIAQVAVRDFSEREAALAASSGRVLLFDDLSLAAAGFRGETWDAQCLRIVETLPQEVYVSFDIDGLSYENCPHTGTPVAGGLGFNQAVWLLDTLVRSGRRIVGFDVVEVTPAREERIDAITGARVLWKLCNLTLKSNVR